MTNKEYNNLNHVILSYLTCIYEYYTQFSLDEIQVHGKCLIQTVVSIRFQHGHNQRKQNSFGAHAKHKPMQNLEVPAQPR